MLGKKMETRRFVCMVEVLTLVLLLTHGVVWLHFSPGFGDIFALFLDPLNSSGCDGNKVKMSSSKGSQLERSQESPRGK